MVMGENPVISTLIVYCPGARPGRRNTPNSFVTAVWTLLVASAMTVTVAPGTTPSLSLTAPVRVPPPVCCAPALTAIASMNTTTVHGASHARSREPLDIYASNPPTRYSAAGGRRGAYHRFLDYR